MPFWNEGVNEPEPASEPAKESLFFLPLETFERYGRMESIKSEKIILIFKNLN